jgi:hypothetical protein
MALKNHSISKRIPSWSHFILWMGLMIAGSTGCVKERIPLNEDTLDEGGESMWGVPLGGGSIALGSAQPWLEGIGVESDPISGNWMWIREFDLFDYSASELWDLPGSSFWVEQYLDENAAAAVNALPSGVTYQIPVSGEIALDMATGMSLQEVFFSGGELLLNVNYTVDLPLEVSVVFPFMTQSGETWVASRTFEGAGSYVWSLPLEGTLLQMPSGNGAGIPFQVTVALTSNGSSVAAGQGISISGSWDWSGWEWIVGTAGEEAIWDFDATTDIPVFAWAQEGILHVADPQVHLRVENESGIPFGWGLESLTLLHPGGSTDVGGWQLQSPPSIAPAPALGSMAITEHVLNNAGTTPPLSDLIDLHPTWASVSGSLGVDPNGPTPHFISRDARVRARGELRFPLWGYASGFGLVDTLDVAVSASLRGALMEPLDWTDLASVTLRMETANALPLELALQVIFLDSLNAPVDSLFADDWMLLQGGMLDPGLEPGDPGFGEVIAPALHRSDFVIHRERAMEWMEMGIERVMVKAVVSTQGADQSWDVRLRPEDALSIQFAAKIHIDWKP